MLSLVAVKETNKSYFQYLKSVIMTTSFLEMLLYSDLLIERFHVHGSHMVPHKTLSS